MEYIEARLIEWGRWCCIRESGAAGFPRRTTIGRLRHEGGILSRSQGSSVVPMESGPEQTERAVTRLRVIRHEWADVLMDRYVADRSGRQIALDMNISESSVRVMLTAARAWISGRLDVV